MVGAKPRRWSRRESNVDPQEVGCASFELWPTPSRERGGKGRGGRQKCVDGHVFPLFGRGGGKVLDSAGVWLSWSAGRSCVPEPPWPMFSPRLGVALGKRKMRCYIAFRALHLHRSLIRGEATRLLHEVIEESCSSTGHKHGTLRQDQKFEMLCPPPEKNTSQP